ncbi:MAG: N-6 DNA methylase [Bacteroidales bacterium]
MIDKEAAFKKISELVERFNEQFASYKKADYNETLTRRDFIDPFFKALGWDIDNEEGYAEAYREVIHEDKVKVGRATKAPDYSFRLVGGKRLFFVEAKKPSVAIKDDILPAYQVRRYGWSAKLPISIITDFEEFAIYDCTKKPIPTDKASVARIKYITFNDYLNEFDFIWNTFSKERVLKGSFDKFIQGTANKKGTATVDKEFLQSLDSWRTYLATSISWNNKSLDEDEINFAVQLTIDRIIFLRIAEDRGVEPYGNLKTAALSPIEGGKGGDNSRYNNLFKLFKEADDKYNSGLFDFKKDLISQDLKVDNKVIKTIINELYYPESPYEFSVLSVEILGSAYEQFLGKVIRITPAHHAKIEEKPEVRKAGGVYYTPEYIVDYIVKNTVGKLVEGKNPKEISNLKIVDPACGSGSFLIGAYQYLLDYHKNYYNAKFPLSSRRGARGEVLTPEGNLTSAEKKRILLNNIYGVDIDVNAVEVTKLSLLLKCMEGETSASIAHQLSMFHERVLPTLENNIKDGNSLIDTDFYANELDFGLEKKIKPFNWQKAFPDVFKLKITKKENDLKNIATKAKEHAQKAMEYASELENRLAEINEPRNTYYYEGFDVVLGNPPYGAVYDETQKQYFISHYKTVEGRYDNFELFIENGIKLLKKDGLLGFIIPSPFLTNLYSRKLRKHLVTNCSIKEVASFTIPVFEDPTVHTCIIIASPTLKAKSEITIKNQIDSIEKLNSKEGFQISQDEIKNNSNYVIDVFISPSAKKIIDKLQEKSKSLGDICFIRQCIKTGNDKEYVVVSDSKLKEPWKKSLRGKSISRYGISEKNVYVKYGDWLARNWKNNSFYETAKIAIRETGKRITATLDLDNRYFLSSLYSIYYKQERLNNKNDLKFLLGILNSEISNYYIRLVALNLTEGAFTKVRTNQLARLPIVNLNVPKEESSKNEIIKLVDQLLTLNHEKSETKLPSKISQIESKIDYCENRINEIVYELYGLTEEEIKIVEDSIK